jgi:hypothetical protein
VHRTTRGREEKKEAATTSPHASPPSRHQPAALPSPAEATRSPQVPGVQCPGRAVFMGGRARSFLRWLRHRSRRVSSSSLPLTTDDTTTSGDPHARSLPHQGRGEEVDGQEEEEEELAGGGQPLSEGYIVVEVCGAAGRHAPLRTQLPRMDPSKKVRAFLSIPSLHPCTPMPVTNFFMRNGIPDHLGRSQRNSIAWSCFCFLVGFLF